MFHPQRNLADSRNESKRYAAESDAFQGRPGDRASRNLVHAREKSPQARNASGWLIFRVERATIARMRDRLILAAALFVLVGTCPPAAIAQDLSFQEMRWRDIGPTRAGRARALAGVPNHPNIFYAGFDNGGVWRSTDYGANWVPLFDDQSTGSIGAIAVAPSNPSIIYVGTGAGIIRPDLAIGNGVYKSIDDGRTWQQLGLRDSQMIAAIAVDPGNPDRVFVAVLGHPYGPNPERGVFRSTDGGRTFEKVLFKDDYTSANEVLHRSAQPQRPLRDACGRSNRASSKARGSATPAWASSSPPTAARTGPSSAKDLPAILQANIAIASSDSNILYATIAPRGRDRSASTSPPTPARTGSQAIRGPGAPAAGAGHAAARAHRRRRSADGHHRSERSARRLHRVDGDVAHDGRRPDVERRPRRARRRRLSAHLDQSERHATSSSPSPIRARWSPQIAAEAGATGTTRTPAAMYHVTTDNAFPYRVCSRPAGFGQRVRPEPIR